MTGQLSSGSEGGAEVCLVTMPYASLERPSLGLGLLNSILSADGIPSVVCYANLWFAERVGVWLYELCSTYASTVFLTGE